MNLAENWLPCNRGVLNTFAKGASDWTEVKGSKMKRITIALLVLGFASAGLTRASAGNREWATAGKVLTGVVAGAVIVNALEPRPTYVYSPGYTYAPVYSYAPAPAPVVYAPPPQPMVYAPAPAVVYAPRPTVVCAPAPVVCAPRPVVVYRPAYCAPPVVSIGFGINFGGNHHHHGRW